MRRWARAAISVVLVSAAMGVPVSAANAQSNTPPQVIITEPSADDAWRVGQTIRFAGQATDPEDGPLSAATFRWRVFIQDATGTYEVARFRGVSEGSFRTPDYAREASLRMELTATDSGGLKGLGGRSLDAEVSLLTLDAEPSALELILNGEREATPLRRRVVKGSTNRISAPAVQRVDGGPFLFVAWSDGGARSHRITAPDVDTTYIARYRQR